MQGLAAQRNDILDQILMSVNYSAGAFPKATPTSVVEGFSSAHDTIHADSYRTPWDLGLPRKIIQP